MKQILFLFLALSFISFSSQQSFSQSASSSARQDARTRTDNVEPDGSVSVDVVKKDMVEALSVIEENYAGSKSLNYNDLFKTSIDSKSLANEYSTQGSETGMTCCARPESTRCV